MNHAKSWATVTFPSQIYLIPKTRFRRGLTTSILVMPACNRGAQRIVHSSVHSLFRLVMRMFPSCTRVSISVKVSASRDPHLFVYTICLIYCVSCESYICMYHVTNLFVCFMWPTFICVYHVTHLFVCIIWVIYLHVSCESYIYLSCFSFAYL